MHLTHSKPPLSFLNLISVLVIAMGEIYCLWILLLLFPLFLFYVFPKKSVHKSVASSSSSSNFISSSFSQSWKYEVFISFRGEDTRKGFVDHLHTALVQRGIQTYKDDETLARGETIGPALFKAIQESQIAVIVFSENYADSSWCLDELAYIVECMENKGQIVMPVFYDVDPSDVRKQNGKYGEAFAKHKRDNKHKVDSWREALVKAGNLSGWVSNEFANGHEAMCIKDIVATISSSLPPLHTNVNTNLIGIETRFQDLTSKLKIGSGGVRMVGIWGVGGGGKTTLASVAYMELSQQFEACCLLENIREESSKLGLTNLQEKFLSLILKTDVMVGSETEGRSMIQRTLRHKRVLVVLDDVDDRKQLDALAGSHSWFGEGSRIIVTTRDEHLLTRSADLIYEVSLLSDDEAIKLFSRHAYRRDNPVEDYEMLSQYVVSYAGGLPLALEILGSFLYDKDNDEWKSTLAKLKRIPDDQVMKILKISYDGLKHEEKELFLDIACFFKRSEMDDAMMVLIACSFYPVIGIKVLAQKSLIKVSDGRLDMHDLVQEMAHYIVRGEHPDDPEKYSRIWKEEDFVNLCAMGEAPPPMETEMLALPVLDSVAVMNYLVSDSDNDLEAVLKSYASILSNYENHQPSYDSHRLSNIIANMKKLRWISWARYPLSSIPSSFQPTKLGCLMLTSSKLTQLWEGYKHLPNLKILDLRESKELMRTPDFEGLPRLEILNLEHCESLEEIHPSIGYLERLISVNMAECKKLETFPPIIRMKSLETLDLSFCSLQMFPDIQTNMDSLVTLLVRGNGIEIIPPSVGKLCTNLVYFHLWNCGNLKRIEGNFRLLKRLKYLNLSSCDRLEKLAMDFFNEECCLEELSLSVSPKLPQFPPFLRKLDLRYCNLGDEDIPSDMTGLINLQVLDLSYNDFSRLNSSLSQIPCLKFLNLSSCDNLVELPDLPSTIVVLIAEYCRSLQIVGDLSNYKWLWKVSFYGNNKNKLIGVERVMHSMFQKNAVEDRFMSIMLPHRSMSNPEELMTITLQLPQNWYDDFGGFLLSADYLHHWQCRIIIKQEMLFEDSQPDHDHWEEFEKNPKSFNECGLVGFVPFGSLRHTSWWSTKHTRITFKIKGTFNPKVGLVPKKIKSKERPIDYSECWEEKGAYVDGRFKTFEIEDASKSTEIEIVWRPSVFN